MLQTGGTYPIMVSIFSSCCQNLVLVVDLVKREMAVLYGAKRVKFAVRSDKIVVVNGHILKQRNSHIFLKQTPLITMHFIAYMTYITL